jgi:hypothetical protein
VSVFFGVYETGNSEFYEAYMRITYRILVERPKGRRPLGRPGRRWEDNIKIDLQGVGWGMNWIELAQDRDRWRALVNAVMNLQVP